eukprot:Hpha_TRINITY_DN21535_c0_g1::TRINITY_DN21535_c0_g1_i1::g.19::m.19
MLRVFVCRSGSLRHARTSALGPHFSLRRWFNQPPPGLNLDFTEDWDSDADVVSQPPLTASGKAFADLLSNSNLTAQLPRGPDVLHAPSAATPAPAHRAPDHLGESRSPTADSRVSFGSAAEPPPQQGIVSFGSPEFAPKHDSGGKGRKGL